MIGLGFGLCGALIAWHRPTTPLGWMYAVGGLLQTCSALAAPLALLLLEQGFPTWLVRLDLTVAAWAWPVNITLVPISLLLLPDGRLPSPRWRPVAALVVATAPLFVLEVGLGEQAPPGLPPPYLLLDAATYASLSWLWLLSEVRWALSVLVGVGCLVVRYRSGGEQVRRQLLWLVAAAAVIAAGVVPWALVAGTPVGVLFTIPLLPAAVAVAVLRHQLLDIRLVVARGLTYAVLSAIVLVGYAALVVVLSGVASALLVALLALPLRNRLQRAVDRLLYGERGNPIHVATRVGSSLDAGLTETLEEVRRALRLPYVGVLVDGAEVAGGGAAREPLARLPLARGDLVVGLRTGEARLSPADERVLRLLTGPLSTAVHANELVGELQASRDRLVVTREDERRRLRRELHDGLGPLLTGVALSGDAAANLARGPATPELATRVDAVRRDTRSAIVEIRRIVEDLGSPALDELGLVAALRLRAEQVRQRGDGSPLRVEVSADDLPRLPDAVEHAVYRIVTESLTNVVRHSTASSVRVRVAGDGRAVVCEVVDDGGPTGPWRPGVGLAAIAERVAELGGTCSTGPDDRGGRVHLSIPIGAS